MLLFPIIVVFGPVGCPLFVVVGVRYIHALLYPFFVFTDMKLAPLVLGHGTRAHIGLSDIFKFPCRRTDRVSRLCGRSLGRTASRVVGDFPVLITFLFQVRGQSNQNLFVIGTLLVPLSGRLLVCVQVYHIDYEGAGVES